MAEENKEDKKGAFVGWNFPQPFWAKMMQEKIQAMITKK